MPIFLMLNIITEVITCYFGTTCGFCLLFNSSDTLWELAAAEVLSRETEGGEEDGGETAVSERSVFLMGSKAGVRFQTTDSTFIAF